ncbi:hypothetical protein OE766_14270 [Pararhizobium sp. YC-54]|uniref:hypothetical protein n=1 Tax=Pararhizobium sp. YC-54 TaxID=2986920 RepID=UPI0021F77096|nr:hypothetical protein [Pararhizobium sp. YC-54]MCV9999411.1 hypothetical protein [Pararhizobium sp. YC-54]
MPLSRKNGASAPKELGLFWPMQTPEGKTIDVYIYASTLQSFDADPMGPVGLLKRHRALLETIASEKYDRDGVGDADPLRITDDDLRSASGKLSDETEMG